MRIYMGITVVDCYLWQCMQGNSGKLGFSKSRILLFIRLISCFFYQDVFNKVFRENSGRLRDFRIFIYFSFSLYLFCKGSSEEKAMPWKLKDR